MTFSLVIIITIVVVVVVILWKYKTSQVALVVKNLPANAGDKRNASLILDQEDPLKKGMATHSSILAWRTPWTEEPGRLQSMGVAQSWT